MFLTPFMSVFEKIFSALSERTLTKIIFWWNLLVLKLLFLKKLLFIFLILKRLALTLYIFQKTFSLELLLIGEVSTFSSDNILKKPVMRFISQHCICYDWPKVSFFIWIMCNFYDVLIFNTIIIHFFHLCQKIREKMLRRYHFLKLKCRIFFMWTVKIINSYAFLGFINFNFLLLLYIFCI